MEVNRELPDRSLLFSMLCFLQGSTLLLPTFVGAVTKQDSWMVVITGLIAILPVVWIYCTLLRQFPGKNLIQIHHIVFGPVLGRVLSCLYIFFFLSVAALNARDVGAFIMTYMMPSTPMIAVIVIFGVVCIYAVRSGIENMTRYTFILFVMAMVFTVLIFILLLKDMDFRNFLPMFDQPFTKYVQGTHIIAIIPLGEIMIFMMVTPYARNQRRVPKNIVLALVIGAANMLLIVVRDFAVLGLTALYLGMPSYESVRLINIAHIITRMEILVGLMLLVMFFVKVSFTLFAAVIATKEVLCLKSYKPLATVVGIIFICYSQIVFPTSMENAQWGPTAAPVFSSIFELVFPIITLITAKLRRKKLSEVKASA